MTAEIRRFTRKELYDKVWRTPVDALAKELGMSGRGLGKPVRAPRHSCAAAGLLGAPGGGAEGDAAASGGTVRS